MGGSGRDLGQLIRELNRAAAVEEGDAHENKISQTRDDRNVAGSPSVGSSRSSRSPIKALGRGARMKNLDSTLQFGGRVPRRGHASWSDPLGRPRTQEEAGVLRSSPELVTNSCDSAEAHLPGGPTSHG